MVKMNQIVQVENLIIINFNLLKTISFISTINKL